MELSSEKISIQFSLAHRLKTFFEDPKTLNNGFYKLTNDFINVGSTDLNRNLFLLLLTNLINDNIGAQTAHISSYFVGKEFLVSVIKLILLVIKNLLAY